ISYNRKAGVAILGGDLHNLQIAGNDIEYNHDPAQKQPDSADVLIDAREGVASEITLSANTIQGKPSPNGANVRIVGKTGDDGFPTARLIAVTGTIIGSQSVSLDVDNAQRITVAGNTIYDGQEAGMIVRASDGVSVTGNTHGWSYRPEKPRPDNLRFERSRS